MDFISTPFEHIVEFFNNNKGFLGGFSIAVATVVAVLINYRYSRYLDLQQKNEKIASFATAIASELADNVDILTSLYLEIKGGNTSIRKINEYQNFQTHAYESLLTQMGDIGADLSFMIVDVYGDLRKLSNRVDMANKTQIEQEEDDFLEIIQITLAKAMTSSIVIFMYSDYLNGPAYCREVSSSRELWIERNLYHFCKYAAEADEEMEFVEKDEEEDISFVTRFPNKEDRKQVRELIKALKECMNSTMTAPRWKAQLMFRAISYKVYNTLAYFLDFELGPYREPLEKEYRRYLS